MSDIILVIFESFELELEEFPLNINNKLFKASTVQVFNLMAKVV